MHGALRARCLEARRMSHRPVRQETTVTAAQIVTQGQGEEQDEPEKADGYTYPLFAKTGGLPP